MSGSFNRSIYDIGAYNAALEISTGPIQYTLDPMAVNRCDPCRIPEPGFIGKVGVSLTHQRPLVDVESDLFQIGVKNTKDPSAKFQSQCPQCGDCNSGYPCGGGVVSGCNNCQEQLNHLPMCGFGSDYTRISNPICTARGVGVNRFQPLCLNPQDENRWRQISEVGISYRNVVKDNHIPCVPQPIDQTPLLPTGKGPIPCPKVSDVCGVHRQPLHKHGLMVNRNWNSCKDAHDANSKQG